MIVYLSKRGFKAPGRPKMGSMWYQVITPVCRGKVVQCHNSRPDMYTKAAVSALSQHIAITSEQPLRLLWLGIADPDRPPHETRAIALHCSAPVSLLPIYHIIFISLLLDTNRTNEQH